MDIRLNGKRALVTGANSGIGKAAALALGEAGAAVAVNYLERPEDADEVVRTIREGGGRALALQADVSRPGEVAALFQRLDAEWGGLDVLVNNAGVDGSRSPAWETDPDDWHRVLEVNLFGVFLCAREALRRMVPARSGVVANVTSVHEVIPWNGYSAYTTSKAGISMLTKTLALEAAPEGVRVVAVAPGAVKTPINRQVWSDPDKRSDLLEKIPAGRIGAPEDIARAVVFLASDAAAYVTGTTLFVDGGMTLYPSFEHGG
jgi:NAD(P)-dependent dehydrogenase (short-subunit alcohol dehydrogenase family)